MSDALENRLKAVYAAGGDQEKLDRAYDDWAREYEKDFWSTGNPYLAITAGLVARHIPDTAARILDGGCGPGALAHILNLLGYRNIEGLDASEGMLAVARARECYAALHHTLLGPVIDLPDESYDAVLLSGILTQGHAAPDSLDGVLAVAKPGAPIVFSMGVSAYETEGYREKCEDLVACGLWTSVEDTDPFQTYPFLVEHADVRHWISVYRKAVA